jgi:hypothetical protein
MKNLQIIIAIFLLFIMGKRSRNTLQDARNVRRRLLYQQKKEQQKIKKVVVHKVKRCIAIRERKTKSREVLTRIAALQR